MKVAFNTSALKTGHELRGIGTYARNLLEVLKKTEGIEVQEFENQNQIKDADVVHYPFFDFFRISLPLMKRFRMVVTVHDVIPLIFPEHYPPGIKGSLIYKIQKLSLKNTKAIVTGSKSSKKDVVSYLQIPDEKVFAVYLAASSVFKKISNEQVLKKIKQKYNLPDKFAVYAGGVNWNKNLLGIAYACRKSQVDLVMIGGSFETEYKLEHSELKNYKKFLTEFKHDKRVQIKGYIPIEDFVAIVNSAEVLLLPSFYEGFGLPILEAQACGVPVITSNVASMPEVAGEGAIFVNPYNVDEISKAISRIIQSKEKKDELVRKGFENIKKFSWEKCAGDTIRAYQFAIQT